MHRGDKEQEAGGWGWWKGKEGTHHGEIIINQSQKREKERERDLYDRELLQYVARESSGSRLSQALQFQARDSSLPSGIRNFVDAADAGRSKRHVPI